MDYIKANSMKVLILVLGLSAALILVISLLNSEPRSKDTSNPKDLLSAAKSYFNKNEFLLPKNNYETLKITGKDLVTADFIKDNLECDSYVTVTNVNDEFYYNTIIKCNKETDTETLYDELLSVVVENSEGLNKVGNEYYFKGETINNNLIFNDTNWKIIKIDENGNIKIMYHDQRISNIWDDRFNIEVNNDYGINTFSLSRIKDTLNEFIIENFDDSSLSNLTLYDLCIGKRNELKDKTKDGIVECKEKLKDQLVGLIQGNEYLMASNDSGCTSKSMLLCQNYNYIPTRIWTQTASSNNTYKVLYTSSDYGLKDENASRNYQIKPVITLRKDVIIQSGDGSSTDPYVVK